MKDKKYIIGLFAVGFICMLIGFLIGTIFGTFETIEVLTEGLEYAENIEVHFDINETRLSEEAYDIIQERELT